MSATEIECPMLWQYLVLATEQWLPCVHLHQDAAQAPHVDGQVVGYAQ